MKNSRSLRATAVAAATAAAIFVSASGSVKGAIILANDIVAERVGGDASYGGSASAANSAGTAVFIDEFANAGLQTLPVQSIPLPTTASGGNLALVESGTATSAGLITRSADGTAIMVPGYNATVGLAGVASSAPGTVNRTIGVITSSGAVDTTRGFSNGPSANFRGLASDNGSRAWVSTQGSASAVGVMFHSGAGVLAAASTLNGNTRALSVQGGQLFVSSGAAAPGVGITPLGALPSGAATAGATIATTSGTGTASPYEFLFVDLGPNDYLGTGFDTLYVADDRSIANGGGLQKWSYNGSTWGLAYTLNSGISFGLRGLAGEVVAGNPVLYVSDANSGSTNSLWTITDTGAASAFSKIADSPANTQFRGVSLAPVAPEPATIGMLGGAAVVLAVRRRRWNIARGRTPTGRC